MGKVKNKSVRKILFEYSFLLVVSILAALLIAIELNTLFLRFDFYVFEGEAGIVVIFILLMLIEIIGLNRFYSHLIHTEVRKLTNQVENLQDKNLEIFIGHSKITEIEQTLRAFDKLQTELVHSLHTQWSIEKQKNESITALGHDMKTPIAIMQGNSELLEESGLNQNQKTYNDSNLYNVLRMKQYTEALLEAFTSNRMEKVDRVYQNFDAFFDKLIINYQVLAEKFNRTLETEVRQCGESYFDALMLERAVNNVVMNAFEHTNGDVIRLTLKRDDSMCLTIEDSGKGFSPELLKYATEAFVIGDKSRAKVKDELHLGIGLYQTKQIVMAHEGKLILSNSDKLGGAKVEIIL